MSNFLISSHLHAGHQHRALLRLCMPHGGRVRAHHDKGVDNGRGTSLPLAPRDDDRIYRGEAMEAAAFPRLRGAPRCTPGANPPGLSAAGVVVAPREATRVPGQAAS